MKRLELEEDFYEYFEKQDFSNLKTLVVSEGGVKDDKFLTCMSDKTFKYIIQTKAGMNVIKEIFKMITGHEIKSVELKNPELKVTDKNIKGKRVDFLLDDGRIVLNTEVNNGSVSNLLRNYMYINTLLINDVLEGEEYNQNKLYYSLNFSRKTSVNLIIDEYGLSSLSTGILVIKELKMIFLDMVKVYKMCYNQDISCIDKLYRYVGMFIADQKLLEKLSEGDELLMEFKKNVEQFNTKKRFWISPEEDEIMWENTIKNEAKREGRREGKKEGKKEGLLQTAKNMLLKGLDKTLISEVTGLTMSQINNINIK